MKEKDPNIKRVVAQVERDHKMIFKRSEASGGKEKDKDKEKRGAASKVEVERKGSCL